VVSFEGLEVDQQVGAYRVTARLGEGERALFTAKHDDDEPVVCLLELREDEVSAYTAAATGKVEHAHLAEVREVRTHEGAPLLAFERVEGTPLTQRLKEVGKKPTVEAVGTALRVSDALSTLHDAGGVHGFLHTDSVIVDPPERLGPVLTFAPVPADERTFHSPERGETGKPSVADDAWAAAGLLHMMLTGTPPPKQGYTNAEEVAAAGVADPALQTALLHGLNSDPEQRSVDVRPLKRELARWFVEHVGEDQRGHSHSTLPPPLPAGKKVFKPTPSRPPEPPPSKGPRIALLALGCTVAGVVVAWGVSAAVRTVNPPVPAASATPEAPSAPSATALAKAIELSEVPVTGEEQGQSGDLDKTASCVASYLPKGAFGKPPNLAGLCSETDPSKGAQALRVAIVGAAPKGSVTDAMKVWARLGWYDMAAYAVVRAGCCEDAKPLELPEPGKGCESLAAPLHDLTKEIIGGKSYTEAKQRFDAAVTCEVALGRGNVFGRAQKPQAGEDAAFKELVEAIAH